MSYDRYRKMRISGKVGILPMVNIDPKSTDFFEEYKQGITRLDNVSYDYYGDANYDWLILMANPSLGNMEFEIPDGSTLRIPYPLDITLENFNNNLTKYNTAHSK